MTWGRIYGPPFIFTCILSLQVDWSQGKTAPPYLPKQKTPCLLHTMQEQIFNYLDKQSETAVYLQREMVAIPALGPENGGQGEALKAEFLLTYLKHLGLTDIRELPAPDSRVENGQRPNLAAILPGSNQQETLWVISHLDVVPPGDSRLWNTDPFQLHREGDIISGRGVEDNQHGLVASLLALQALMQTSTKPRCNLGLLFVADEETGNKYGLDFVFRQHPELFQAEDRFLVPDFGTPDSKLIEIAEKSLLWLRFTVAGRQCHGSTPDKGLNSLLIASELILKLRSLYQLFNHSDDKFSPPWSTFEATKKEANVPNINTIPGQDIFYLDCRILPHYDVQEVLQASREMSGEVAQKYATEISMDIVHQESSPETPADAPLVSELLQAVAMVYNTQASPKGIGGGTVAAYPRKQGYPAAVWATLFGNAHQPNEYTSIQNMINDAKVMATLVL